MSGIICTDDAGGLLRCSAQSDLREHVLRDGREPPAVL